MEVNKMERVNLVKKYFTKTPQKPNYFWNFFWISIFIILILLGVSDSNLVMQMGIGKQPIIALGLIFLIISFLVYLKKRNIYRKAYNETEPKATDEQMDKWLAEGKEMVKKTAMQRLDIDIDDTSRDPLVMDGPVNNEILTPGKDKYYRFRKHDILLFFLTEHNVSTFQCIFDIGIGEILEDKTKEFPYKDITNLETVTSADFFYFEGEKKTYTDGLKSFSLFTSGGNKISINYSFIKDNKDYSGNKLPPSDDENTIKAIRKRLKEYKDKLSSGLPKPN